MIPDPDPLPLALPDAPQAPGPLDEAPWRRFPLTKTYSPGDLLLLAEELQHVDPEWLTGQAAPEARSWEYVMALRALRRWGKWSIPAPEDAREQGQQMTLLDVGGAGSPLCRVVERAYPEAFATSLIDPAINHTIEFEAEFKRAPASVDVILAISVIEHVKKSREFLTACTTLLKPGGLLVLTTDYWDAHGPDTAHFHWMRERIYNRESIVDLLSVARKLGLERFGAADWTFHGNHVYGDYTFLSLALTKKLDTAIPEVPHV